MDKLGSETDRLCQTYPEKAHDIAAKMDEAKARWEALKLNAEQRKRGLDRSYNRHRFMADYRELCEWIRGIQVRRSGEFENFGTKDQRTSGKIVIVIPGNLLGNYRKKVFGTKRILIRLKRPANSGI